MRTAVNEEVSALTFPGFGGVDLDRWLPEAAAVYTEEVVQRLADQHKIKDPGQREELRKHLHCSGAVYLQGVSDSVEFTRWDEAKNQFSQIVSGAAKLLKLISNLDEEAAKLFWYDENSLRDLHFMETGPLGHSVRHIHLHDGWTAKIHLRQPDHLESLAIIGTYARRAGDRVPKQPSGRPSNFAVRNWTENMRLFWTECLRRKFTFTPHKSPFFRFCIDAMKPLNPSVSEGNIATAMRANKTHDGVIRAPKKAEEKSKNPV